MDQRPKHRLNYKTWKENRGKFLILNLQWFLRYDLKLCQGKENHKSDQQH